MNKTIIKPSHVQFGKALLAVGTLTITACSGGAGGITDINGTGYTDGTIERFGSVQVNGIVFNTDNAVFEVDDQPGQQTQLFSGQRVEVSGNFDASTGDGTATRVVFDAELEGSVSAVFRRENRLEALGQNILIDGTTVFENTTFATLAVNQYIEVSGNYDANNNLRAFSIEVISAPPSTVELKGNIANLDSAQQTFSLNGQPVNYASAVIDPSNFIPTNGSYIEVEGRLVAGNIDASRLELESEVPAQEGLEVEKDGIISAVQSPTRFTMGNLTVEHNGSTQFEGGTSADLLINTRVEVEGFLDGNAVLQADEIDIQDENEQNLSIKLEAPVQSINSNAGTVTILNLTVSTSRSTVIKDSRDDQKPFGLSNIQIGDFVEIRAFSNDSNLTAGRIERDEDEARVILQALVTSFDQAASQVVLNGIAVNTANAVFETGDDDQTLTAEQFYAQLMTGSSVKAKGSFDGTQVVATEVSFEENDDETDDDDDDNDDQGDDESGDDEPGSDNSE